MRAKGEFLHGLTDDGRRVWFRDSEDDTFDKPTEETGTV